MRHETQVVQFNQQVRLMENVHITKLSIIRALFFIFINKLKED